SFGTPYFTGLPVGRSEEKRVRTALLAVAAGLPIPEPLPPKRNIPDGSSGARSVLLIGEPLLNESLRACLEKLDEVLAVTCASFFTSDEAMQGTGVLALACEDEAAALLSDGVWDLVIGDPLLKALAPEIPSIRFLSLPHAAVSGRLYREFRLRLFGAAGESLFVSALGGRHVPA
ncbi:MAG TPA: hypothetical protein VLH39_03170, partial [Magnetospirillaceae bacterium]|nr:hypothetical protein [Magnetospirillaceae bacterium]